MLKRKERAVVMRPESRPVLLGAGLKMYMGPSRTLAWIEEIALLGSRHPAITHGFAELFVLPGFLVLSQAVDALAGTKVRVGAQDLFWEDHGPFTGEVSGAELREIGCSLVEVGHAERRNLLSETDRMVSAKTLAAFRNGLTPIICIGEKSETAPEDAAAECIRQLDASLAAAREPGLAGAVVAAYEPQWAIGAEHPADPSYIREVSAAIREYLTADPALAGSRLIYGGTARAGMLANLGDDIDGLFMSRFSHDPRALETVLDEAYSQFSAPAVG